MTFEELLAFRITHGNACGICASTGDTHIDHDHTTGKVRGLLCPNCNSAIGKLREDPALFLAAIKYLEAHRG